MMCDEWNTVQYTPYLWVYQCVSFDFSARNVGIIWNIMRYDGYLMGYKPS